MESTITEFMITIFSSAAFSTLLLGVLAVLTKTWVTGRIKNDVKHEYDLKLAEFKRESDREIELHKANLKSKFDNDLEKLKSELAVIANQKDIVFFALHEIRAEVISQAYSLMVDARSYTLDYMKVYESVNDASKEERRKVALKALDEFRYFFTKNLIYLPKSTATKCIDLVENSTTSTLLFLYNVDALGRHADAKDWMDLLSKVKLLFDKTLKDIESDFRKILGESDT